jgi:GNAT superfamily N-acetyltransferase
MNVRIDLATGGDAPAAVALLARQLDEHHVDLAPGALAGAVAAILADAAKGMILLARQGGEGVGVACLAQTFTLEHGGYVWWLDELYVVPELRSQGIGTAMLHRAIAFAREAGARALELEVEEDHRRAARLYARSGFRALARRRWTLPLGGPDLDR